VANVNKKILETDYNRRQPKRAFGRSQESFFLSVFNNEGEPLYISI